MEQLDSLEGLLEAGIGVKVHHSIIEDMNTFMRKYSFAAFYAAVYEGAWSAYASAYIHPCDEMRSTEGFGIIQNAFINAYV
jgi:hypothetical protein